MILGIDYKPLILICGPTGVGKSDIAVKLAKEINVLLLYSKIVM